MVTELDVLNPVHDGRLCCSLASTTSSGPAAVRRRRICRAATVMTVTCLASAKTLPPHWSTGPDTCLASGPGAVRLKTSLYHGLPLGCSNCLGRELVQLMMTMKGLFVSCCRASSPRRNRGGGETRSRLPTASVSFWFTLLIYASHVLCDTMTIVCLGCNMLHHIVFIVMMTFLLL